MSSFSLSTPSATTLKKNEKGTTFNKAYVEKPLIILRTSPEETFARIRPNICLARLLKVRLQVAYRGCTWMSEHSECS